MIADVLEVVVHVALNMLTNCANRVAGTEINFPVILPPKFNLTR